MCTLWTSLLYLSIPDMPFPVLLSALIRSRFQARPATLLIPIGFSFSRWRSFTVLGTKVAPSPLLMWGMAFTACVVFLFSSLVVGSLLSRQNKYFWSKCPTCEQLLHHIWFGVYCRNIVGEEIKQSFKSTQRGHVQAIPIRNPSTHSALHLLLP